MPAFLRLPRRIAIPSTLVAAGISTAFTLIGTAPAEAHVKWFAPYIVGAAPAPITATLTNLWFWLAIVLVLGFFIITRIIEKGTVGESVLLEMDRLSNPLWLRLDDFVRVVIGAFFVAIFAVGGIYLTPDLKTGYEWVSWLQLAIAAGVFSRKTMPFSAAGIILLWVLALRDYDIFHLLDYLALGVAVAGYLVLEASDNPELRKHRFEMLRWGVAIALMWSSLEKFAYPEWFYPLVDEKPFLTFGMPRNVFIPMAGVAEFTMGFGLLWTPLVRRLSAFSLFIIFNSAVYPFGRIDLVGHALIMAIIVAIAVDPTREMHFLPHLKKSLKSVPVGLVAALVIVAGSYWGLHTALYGTEGSRSDAGGAVATHTFDPEHPHAATPAGSPGMESMSMPNTSDATLAFEATMASMNGPMMEGMADPDPDRAFVRGMIPHHQGAIDMGNVILKFGTDPSIKALAAHIISDQQYEIVQMQNWLAANGGPATP
ncbi:MAG: DUF305 domain-containing protein [Alphaproteobacteria bacterium]|nr:DUF305 domain-containing protein [Alphaproteobacteria bacterium]